MLTQVPTSPVLSVSARFQIQGAPERIGRGTPLVPMQTARRARCMRRPTHPSSSGGGRVPASDARARTHVTVHLAACPGLQVHRTCLEKLPLGGARSRARVPHPPARSIQFCTCNKQKAKNSKRGGIKGYVLVTKTRSPANVIICFCFPKRRSSSWSP